MSSEECISINVNANCEDIARKLNEARNRYVIVIAGAMTVEYIGRASSYAPQGVRLFIAKPDGSLVIHEAQKVEPLNWQPPKSVIKYECRGGNIYVVSRRFQPVEEVIVEFSRLYFIWLCKLAVTNLVVIGRESDIVKAILTNTSVIESNAKVMGIDVPTPYGKVDIVLKKDDGTLILVEVKNERAGIAAVMQLKRYVDYYRERGINVEGVLVAPSITDEAYAYIVREGMRFVDLKSIFSAVVQRDRQVQGLDKYIR